MRLVIDLQGAQGGNHDRGIGRYSRELALAMARAPRGHEVIVALSSAMPDTAEALLGRFSGVLGRASVRLWHPPRGVSALSPDPSLRRAAEMLRARFLCSLRPDVVHVSSVFEGLGDDAVTATPAGWERPPTVATCYDLIPLIRHDTYFGPGGPLAVGESWYYRRVQEMAGCDGLLAISDSSRGEAIDHLGFDPERVFNVRAGIDPQFRAPGGASGDAVPRRYGIGEPFILFLGAGDARKNEAGLVAAYARLSPALRDRFRLVLVGRIDPAPLREAAARLGVAEDRVTVVPFVAEADLPALYAACALFVFPSLHEGFGLPALEAMACGAPVIASGTSSLPEVVGRADALFDPAEPNAIADAMARVLENPALRASLAAWGPEQAARFTWADSAERAWDALERVHAALGDEAASAGHPAVQRPISRRSAVPRRRERLAFVSPLPPQASGIADYAAELVPALARHYDITLVSEEPISGAPLLASAFPRLPPAAFLSRAGEFDRVLYQLGNSHFHDFQIKELMPAVPGVVVLHDGFLSDYRSWMARIAGTPAAFQADLLDSHGYPALVFDAQHGREETLRRFPCTRSALSSALAVIQHSEHGRELTASQFGERDAPPLEVVPLLRRPEILPGRAAARRALGIGAEEVVVCSFGMVTPKKRPDDLARAWAGAGIAGRLVFVGDVQPQLGTEILSQGNGIEVTGRVGAEAYRNWLAAADVAVQLRRESRGETSRAAADCFAAALPVVMNRHGSAAELPDGVASFVPDEAAEAEIAAAIVALVRDPERRAAQAGAASEYLRSTLAPDAIARRYREIIEHAYDDAPGAALLRELGAAGLDAAALLPAARAVADTFRSPRPGRILLDVSELARRDSHSGIQRVVRELMRRTLMFDAPGNPRHESVRFHDGRLRRAHEVAARVLGLVPAEVAEAPIDAGPGDVLICLDPNPSMTTEEFGELRQLRLNGVRVVLVVYDTLPVHQPQLFPAGITVVRNWYAAMVGLCDAALCISRACADDLLRWLDEEPGLRDRPLPVGWFHLGSDLPAPAEQVPEAAAEQAPRSAAATALARLKGRPSFLMVGTVEPRKGHRQALDAFEALWQAGHDVVLVIIGKPGWMMDDVAARLRTSPQLGRQLFWLSSCSDEDMRAFYQSCSALIMASSHEGFGLPIVEAFRAGLPVIARGIPVFREIARENALYFEGTAPDALARAVLEWVALDRENRAPRPGTPLSWDESHAQMMRFVSGEAEPYALWRPGEERAALGEPARGVG